MITQQNSKPIMSFVASIRREVTKELIAIFAVDDWRRGHHQNRSLRQPTPD